MTTADRERATTKKKVRRATFVLYDIEDFTFHTGEGEWSIVPSQAEEYDLTG